MSIRVNDSMRGARRLFVFALVSFAPALARAADEYEQAPIEYSRSTPDNRISRLQQQLERGERSLKFDADLGYLRALMEALRISPTSQTLVYSKTSLQRARIAPRTPRALYFDDEVYLGYCHDGEQLEISVADPQLGAVFYLLDQTETSRPRLERQTDRCLLCHGSGRTNDVPGHLARSLTVDLTGLPVTGESSHYVDHTTPIADRWGGWYVTGQASELRHMGNIIMRDPRGPRRPENLEGRNVTDLSSFFPTKRYLTPHSDIVALMVLEHQMRVQNLITETNFATRRALVQEVEINRALGEPEHQRREATTRRLDHAARQLVEGLLFTNEAPLPAPIAGTAKFAEHFAGLGPRDPRGRSLREFDLQTRMFKYPCSHVIYSPAFDGLPIKVRSIVAEQLRAVLDGRDTSDSFKHLSATDRAAILEILTATKPELWKLGAESK